MQYRVSGAAYCTQLFLLHSARADRKRNTDAWHVGLARQARCPFPDPPRNRMRSKPKLTNPKDLRTRRCMLKSQGLRGESRFQVCKSVACSLWALTGGFLRESQVPCRPAWRPTEQHSTLAAGLFECGAQVARPAEVYKANL